MAKTDTGVEAIIQLRKTAAGVWRARVASYGSPLDDTDPDIRYDNKHTHSPRDLTAGELAGTLQAFLDACDADYRSANGIT